MELVNISYAGKGPESQNLSPLDRQLVTSNYINSQFGEANDYLELFIYNENGLLLDFDYDGSDYYPYLTSNPKNNTYSSLTLDPEKDLKSRGFNRGNLTIQYNFNKKLFNSAFGTFYWIKEISTSRTELKLASQVLSNTEIKNGFNQYQGYISNKNYYPVFYLNFGNNQTAIADNVAYTEDDSGGYLLVKLYAPLSPDYDLKTQLWIIDKVADPVTFTVNIQVQADGTENLNSLRGPNFNVTLNTKNGQTTPYYNYNNLLSSNVSSSYQKLLSYYQDKSVEINVDYSNFSNFIHFSSATERVNNFVYKLGLIESYNSQLSQQQSIGGGTGTQPIVSSSIGYIQSSINNIIEKFDTYEYFLYFNSSSWAWPKLTATQPYQLYSVTSSEAANFLGSESIVPTLTTQSLLFSASYYDTTNKDLLHNSIPQYLLDDPSNTPYVTFLDMIGQHFDNIWIYYKDLSTRYDATNNPDTGISLDIVSDALKGFGMQLYTNSNVSDNLYYTLFGINTDGGLLPPTGSELITNYVTSSLTTLSAATIQDELYKRLYHNLPYLLKTKGTQRGIKALISTFGIPEEILTIREFGGNPIDSVDGAFDLDTTDYKISISTGSNGNVTGSLMLSSSLLSPYATLQFYDKNHRVNSTNIEIGFSPADTINTNITASQGFFDINQLIGSPGYQQSSSYAPLVSASNAYFANYTQPSSVWEYIRLIKFYNNSLFKMIKDFVPARANLSTGIIVKSHMLERNKYARYEPSMSLNMNYSQSIDMLYVEGSTGGALSGSTYWTGLITTPLGNVAYTSSQNYEQYTGELAGSEIVVTTGDAFDQSENSNLPATSSGVVTISRGALYQNVTSSVRSLYLLDLDYTADQSKPVNFNIITESLNNSQINNYADYTNPMSPYAYVQDYNYFLERSILPRYKGSQTVSATYTTYTVGDDSYGKTAAIDKIKYQYAYLVDIYSSSMFLPKRSNAQIKYVIDNNQNVLDLTKANNNIFSVQNIYKSGETSNISLFEYDERNPFSQQLVNNPTTTIYEGGFRYLPILHEVSGSRSSTTQSFTVDTPIERTIQGSSGGGVDPNSPELQSSNWRVGYYVCEQDNGSESIYFAGVSASYHPNGASTPQNVTFDVFVYIMAAMNSNGTCGTLTERVLSINTGQSSDGTTIASDTSGLTPSGLGSGCSSESQPQRWTYTGFTRTCTKYIDRIAQRGGGGGGTTFTTTLLTTNVSASQNCLYYLSESKQIVFDSAIAYYYDYGLVYNSTSDDYWSTSPLERVITPFTLNVGDRISLYNTSSLGWDERFEYSIKNIIFTGSGVTGSRLIAEVDRSIDGALLSSGSGVPIDAFTGSPFRACRYVVWKHLPDETNVMLRYNPKDSTIVENGLLFPQYIDQVVQANAGNTVKALKQQNLI